VQGKQVGGGDTFIDSFAIQTLALPACISGSDATRCMNRRRDDSELPDEVIADFL